MSHILAEQTATNSVGNAWGLTLCGKRFATVYTEDTVGRVALLCSGCNDRTGA